MTIKAGEVHAGAKKRILCLQLKFSSSNESDNRLVCHKG